MIVIALVVLAFREGELSESFLFFDTSHHQRSLCIDQSQCFVIMVNSISMVWIQLFNESILLSSHTFVPIILSYRKGKHTSIAKTHINEVVGYFSNIDPILADLVLQSKPTGTATNAASKSNKRKPDTTELLNGSPKKKPNVESNGSLTLSQREKRAMELLASYLEERGGM